MQASSMTIQYKYPCEGVFFLQQDWIFYHIFIVQGFINPSALADNTIIVREKN